MPKSVCLSIHIHWETTPGLGLQSGADSHSDKETCLWFLKPHWLIWQELQLTSRGSVHVTPGEGEEGREEETQKEGRNHVFMLTSTANYFLFFFTYSSCVDPQGSFYLSHACHQRWGVGGQTEQKRAAQPVHEYVKQSEPGLSDSPPGDWGTQKHFTEKVDALCLCRRGPGREEPQMLRPMNFTICKTHCLFI